MKTIPQKTDQKNIIKAALRSLQAPTAAELYHIADLIDLDACGLEKTLDEDDEDDKDAFEMIADERRVAAWIEMLADAQATPKEFRQHHGLGEFSNEAIAKASRAKAKAKAEASKDLGPCPPSRFAHEAQP